VVADYEAWDGHEWELHVLRLLQDRYGAENVQKVPAKHKGDCGLDYFCLDRRVVYQCYAVEEPVDVAARATKQKTKMTTDVGKFCDPSKGAARMFDGYKIKRWILAVPLHDSREVVEHAMKKTAEVVTKDLPHVDREFQVLVHDRSDFDDDSWKRRAQLRKRIRPVVSPTSHEEVVAVASGDHNLTTNLRGKLQIRFADLSALDDAVEVALRVSLESQNIVEALRESAPDAFEDVTRLAAQRLRRLGLGSRGAGNIDRLDAEIEGLKSSILAAVPNLDPGFAETIAFGAVSEWLMRCPLRLE
jgi:hypothetical protein